MPSQSQPRLAQPRLVSLATAVPSHRLDQGAVMARAGQLFDRPGGGPVERMLSVYGNAGIETRYSCMPPDWYEEPHGWREKNRLYIDNAVELLARAATDCLARARLGVADIDAIVAVSTTGIATPSLDALIMERLGTRRDVERLPVFGLGCAGGVIGLARAAALARATPEHRILVLVVELCGLTFRRSDHSKSNVIATALFGDGAAAAVVSCRDSGPTLDGWAEHTWRDSLDIMGWSVEEDGFGVVFSRDIPSLTRTDFRAAAQAFMARSGMTFADIDRFVCHPGGAKVLDALEEAFDLAPGGLVDSRSVLRDYGNMSAVTVLFVLERVLAGQPSGGRFLLSTLGPGFTAAFLMMGPA